MTELFSNERLIDYFALIDVEISNIDRSLNSDVFDKLSQAFYPEASPCLKIDYSYAIKKVYPRKAYNDYYTLNFDTFFPLMPEERVYLSERPNSSYSLIIPGDKGRWYYVFFYKVYLEVNKTNESISKIKEFDNGNIALYSPKYLCFISLHPFFTSFKNLLEEIFVNSTKSGCKCFKIENILNILLYRIYLPKYTSTQISFCLGDNVYYFCNSKFKTEIGFKFFFSKISIDNAVMLLIAMLLNSIIVIFHSDLEIISPFIYLMTQLIYPLPLTYSIINNLTPDHLGLLGFNGGLIAGVYKNDFNDLSCVVKENFTHIVYYDIDQDMLLLESNEVLREKKIVPVEKVKALIGRIGQVLHMKQDINDSNSNANSINTIDAYIRSALFDFMIELFNGINLDKQIILNEDVSSGLTIEFDYDLFLKESIVDYIPLLEVIRNSNCVNVFIATLKNYYIVNKKKINYANNNNNKDMTEDIMIFFKGIEKKKKGKTTEELFIVNVFNTISISSPAYEKISYKQNNIFVDAFHEELFKHANAINYAGNSNNNYNSGFSLREYFIQAQKRDCDKDHIASKPTHIISSSSRNLPKAQASLSTNQYTQLANQLLFEFKDYLISNLDLLKEYYGLIPNSYLLEAIRSNYLSLNQPQQQQQKLNSNNTYSNNHLSSSSIPSISQNKKQSQMPLTTSTSLITKIEYIESFNKVIKSLNFKGEFHINFASNVIESHCLCPHCNKPNNIWDIRKTFEFSKAMRETKSICKYCSSSYLPFFKAIHLEEVISNKTKKTEIVYKTKKTEYMAFEHLSILFSEGEVSKKLPANLCSNINLLMGEIKCVIDNGIKLYSIDLFIKENDNDYYAYKESNNGNNNGNCNGNGNSSSNRNAYLVKQISKERNCNQTNNTIFTRSKTSVTNDKLLFKKGNK